MGQHSKAHRVVCPDPSKLVERRKKRRGRNYIHVDARLVMLPKGILKGSFGSALLRHPKLFRRELSDSLFIFRVFRDAPASSTRFQLNITTAKASCLLAVNAILHSQDEGTEKIGRAIYDRLRQPWFQLSVVERDEFAFHISHHQKRGIRRNASPALFRANPSDSRKVRAFAELALRHAGLSWSELAEILPTYKPLGRRSASRCWPIRLQSKCHSGPRNALLEVSDCKS